MLNWTTQKRKINDLIPTTHNPRQLTEKQAQDLKTSIEKFNLVEIPVINSDNTILAGHQRLRIMSILGRGEEEIDVRVPDRELTPEEAKEYLIRSNKNNGEWDFDSLANNFDIKDLIEWGFEEWELGVNKDFENNELERDFLNEEAKPNQEILKITTLKETASEIKKILKNSEIEDKGELILRALQNYLL